MSNPLDCILDSLERRVERRMRKLKASEAAFIAHARSGGAVDHRVRASYQVDAARYDEARLALNAALQIDKAYRTGRAK